MFHIQSLLSRCVITGNLLRCEPCPSRSRTEARSSLPCGSTPRILPVLTHLDGYLFFFSSSVCDTRPATSLRALSKSVAYRSTLLLALRLDASYLARSDTPVVIPGGCFFRSRSYARCSKPRMLPAILFCGQSGFRPPCRPEAARSLLRRAAGTGLFPYPSRSCQSASSALLPWRVHRP